VNPTGVVSTKKKETVADPEPVKDLANSTTSTAVPDAKSSARKDKCGSQNKGPGNSISYSASNNE